MWTYIFCLHKNFNSFSVYKNVLSLQEYLKEEPYTAEEIEEVTGEKLTTFLNINASYLEVIKAAKQYKLHQVLFLIPLEKISCMAYYS